MTVSPLFVVWLGASTMSAFVLGLTVLMTWYECRLVFFAEQGRKKTLKRPKVDTLNAPMTFISVIPLCTLQDTFVVLDLLDDLMQQAYPAESLPIVLAARNHFVASTLQLLPIPWERVTLLNYETSVQDVSVLEDEGFLPWVMQSVAKAYTHQAQDASFMACFMPWDRVTEHYFSQAALKALDAPVFQGSVIGKCRLAKGFLQPIEDLLSRIRHRVTLPGLHHAGWSVPLRASGWCVRTDVMYHIPFEGMMYMPPMGFEVALHLAGYRVAWASQLQLLDTHAGIALLDKVVHRLNLEAERMGVLMRYGIPLVQRVGVQCKQWIRSFGTPLEEGGGGYSSQRPYFALLTRLIRPFLGVSTLALGAILLCLDALSRFSYLFQVSPVSTTLLTTQWFGYQTMLGLVACMMVALKLLKLVAARAEYQDYVTAFARQPLQGLASVMLLPWACIRLAQVTCRAQEPPEKILPSASLIRKRLAKRTVTHPPVEAMLHQASESLGVQHVQAPVQDALAFPHHEQTLQHRRELPLLETSPVVWTELSSHEGPQRVRHLPALSLVSEQTHEPYTPDLALMPLSHTAVTAGQAPQAMPVQTLWDEPALVLPPLTEKVFPASEQAVLRMDTWYQGQCVPLLEAGQTQTEGSFYEARFKVVCLETSGTPTYVLHVVYRTHHTMPFAQASFKTSPCPSPSDALVQGLMHLAQPPLRLQVSQCGGCQQFILQSSHTLQGCCACPNMAWWGRATTAFTQACTQYLPDYAHTPEGTLKRETLTLGSASVSKDAEEASFF